MQHLQSSSSSDNTSSSSSSSNNHHLNILNSRTAHKNNSSSSNGSSGGGSVGINTAMLKKRRNSGLIFGKKIGAHSRHGSFIVDNSSGSSNVNNNSSGNRSSSNAADGALLKLAQQQSAKMQEQKMRLAMRDQWIQQQLQKREMEYIEMRHLRLVCGTWNVNSKLPDPAEHPMDQWLHLSFQQQRQQQQHGGRHSDYPDIIFIGLQEIDMSAQAMLKNETASRDAWIRTLEQCLRDHCPADQEQYHLVHSRQLVGMFVVMYARQSLVRYIHDVRCYSIAAGAMGTFGNKGAIALSFSLFGRNSFVFVCSHFSAHQAEVQKRNHNYFEILSKLDYAVASATENNTVAGSGSGGGGGGMLLGSANGPLSLEEVLESRDAQMSDTVQTARHVDAEMSRIDMIQQQFTSATNRTYDIEKNTDVFVWLGDLNYRLDHDIDLVKQMVEKKQFSRLMRYDQLTQEMERSHVFVGWEEAATIDFEPTYKYDPGTLNFDTSEKKRVPSYCDRIMYRGRKAVHIKTLSYDKYDLLISDHLPVSALFEIRGLEKPIDYKFKNLNNQLRMEYDSMHPELVDSKTFSAMERTPVLSLSTEMIQFDDIEYGLVVERELTIRNCSRTQAVDFRFLPGVGHDHYPSWLTITPSNGTILALESTTVTLSVRVQSRVSAKQLNTAPTENFAELNETVLCHVENGSGRNYFVRIKGRFLKSCFGSTLEGMVNLGVNNACRSLQAADTSMQIPVPKEIWRLVDHLYRYGMREEGLFLHVPESADADTTEIRRALDNGTPLSDTISCHSVAHCLVRLLESLQDSVIPRRLFRMCLKVSGSDSACHEFIETTIPPEHYNVFHYIMSFLRELLINSDANRLTPHILSRFWANVLIRGPFNDVRSGDSNGGIASIAITAEERREIVQRSRFIRAFLKSTPANETVSFKDIVQVLPGTPRHTIR